jgi:hypothetical protein
MFRSKSYRKKGTAAKGLWVGPTFVACALVLFACGRSDLGQKYSRDPVTGGTFGKAQEDSFTSVLKKYVNTDARINYQAWRASPDDVVTLKNVLLSFANADAKGMSAQELKSFYINAYNAMTIDLILSHFDETMGGPSSPIQNDRSIRNIGNLDDKVWENFSWKLNGQSVSLNDIENKLLRPLGDARIHFAIVCASKGCPPILNRAFSPTSIDQTLDQLADAFVNSGRNTQFKTARHQIKTSHILEWFAGDFNYSFGSVQAFFAKYAKVVPSDQIQNYAISFSPYDWTLNEPDPVELPPPAPSPSPGPSPVGSGTENPPGSSPDKTLL